MQHVPWLQGMGLVAATMAAVAASLDAPIGSLYHRFNSKEELLARLWLRTAERFQEGISPCAPKCEGGGRAARVHSAVG